MDLIQNEDYAADSCATSPTAFLLLLVPDLGGGRNCEIVIYLTLFQLSILILRSVNTHKL